eukprot:gene173-172_t
MDDDECIVQVPNPLADATDKSQLIPKHQQNYCGITERADVTSFTLGNLVPAQEIVNITNPVTNMPTDDLAVKFNLGQAKSGGSFDICYCQHYDGCDNDLDFFQLVGTVIIGGVANAHDAHVCFLQHDCVVRVQGTLLDVSARIVNYKKSDILAANCGSQKHYTYAREFDDYVNVNLQKSLVGFAGTRGSSSGLDFIDFSLGEPTVTETYTLCYCDTEKTTRGYCDELEFYDQFAGYLYIRGVVNNIDVECNQGENCEASLVGPAFSPMDKLMAIPIETDKYGNVINTEAAYQCGGVQSRATEGFGVNPMAAYLIEQSVDSLDGLSRAKFRFKDTYIPGRSKLCFCAHVSEIDTGGETSCKDVVDFSLEVGTIKIIGVIQDVQMSVLPTHDVVSLKVKTATSGSQYTCAISIDPLMLNTRAPSMEDIQTI